MNNTVLSIVLFGLLLLFIVSPFASLAALMLFLVGYAFLSLLGSIFQTAIGNSDTDRHS